MQLIKFRLTKVCNQINFTVGFCDEIEETFFAINKVQNFKRSAIRSVLQFVFVICILYELEKTFVMLCGVEKVLA